VHAQGESLKESRMREIRLSGLTRGRGNPSLLYCSKKIWLRLRCAVFSKTIAGFSVVNHNGP
jgi:hypothetical protein